MLAATFLAAVMAVAAPAAAQSADITDSVGPLTTIEDKKAVKTCDITDYGAKADGETDISSAITKAFADCKAGGVLVIPEGDYALQEWVLLNEGEAWAFQLDGTIYRTGTEYGNMIFIEHTTDSEFFSSTGAGAMQGYGYEIYKNGGDAARLLRFYDAPVSRYMMLSLWMRRHSTSCSTLATRAKSTICSFEVATKEGWTALTCGLPTSGFTM